MGILPRNEMRTRSRTWRGLTGSRVKRSTGDRPSTWRRAATGAASASTSASKACMALPTTGAGGGAHGLRGRLLALCEPLRGRRHRVSVSRGPAQGPSTTVSGRDGTPDPRATEAEAPATPFCADRLRKVYVEPTNACNLSCTTCVRHLGTSPRVHGMGDVRGRRGRACATRRRARRPARRRHHRLHGTRRAAAAPALPRHGSPCQAARSARRGDHQFAAARRRDGRRLCWRPASTSSW